VTREDRDKIAGLIKRVGFVALAVALAAINPPASLAQATAEPSAPINLVVPTTKLLAIGSFTATATPKLWAPILPSEMRETARLTSPAKSTTGTSSWTKPGWCSS
jgi:hypothetical protein